MDFGYMDVTAECPVSGCAGEETVRVWGQNSASVYKNVLCATCAATYTIKVVVTVSGVVTNYELT